MPESLDDRDGSDVAVETHSLLLSLAGLVDDELLNWCRELVAVGEGDYALELMTAAVQADRVRLPGSVHDALLDTAQRRRVLGRGEQLPPVDAAPRMPHRFTTDPTEHGFPARAEQDDPEQALHTVPVRLLRDCHLWLAWRLTPAGGAPGPLPHPVVLVETGDAEGADVLAYQLGEVLSRAGVFASVEVFSGDRELGDYHRAALAQARAMLGAGEPPSAGVAPLDSGYPEAEPNTGTGPMEALTNGTHGINGTNGVAPVAPQPTPRARTEPGVNGTGHEGLPRRTPENGAPHPGPTNGLTQSSGPAGGGPGATAGGQAVADPSRRPPMHPVDRVITARNSSGPRGPRTDRQPGSQDDVASGLSFERGAAGPASDQHGNEVEHTRPNPAEGDRPRNGTRDDRPAGPPRRPTPRPTPRPHPENLPPEDATELSDVEQRLLRQLHEELASREDHGGPMSDSDDRSGGSDLFRGANGGANGGRKRPPRPGPGPSH
jgi:hypothetical protein